MKLYLSNHPHFQRQWQVRGTRINWRPRYEGVVSTFDSVSPFGWASFEKRVEKNGDEIVWKDDPDEVFAWYEGLDADPGVEVVSGMEGTYKGFFPFQIQGINFMHDQGGLLEWSTGTGKTVGAEGIVLKNREQEKFDLYLIAVKRNNKTNTQRKFLNQAGLRSTILDAPAPSARERAAGMSAQDKREELYVELFHAMDAGEAPIAILNWEKFREDEAAFMLLVEGMRVFVVMDEISDKIKNRETQLWRSISKIFFTAFTAHKVTKGPDKGKMKNIHYPTPDKKKWRTAHHQFLGMTATPVINSPQDYINIIHMLNPSVFGSVKKAEDLFVAARHEKYRHPVKWRDLDRLEQMTAHVVHQVDKDDPDIAKHFPKVMRDDKWIDLDPHDRKLYDVLADEYKKMRREELSILSDTEILSAIQCLGMICSNPRSVLRSAELRRAYEEGETDKKEGSAVALKLVDLLGEKPFVDEHSAKMESLIDDLMEHKGKATVFTRMNASLIPFIEERFTKEGITYVTYVGGLSDKKLQAIQDKFREDAEVKVFLSSDAGSDSIDLEVSSLCIHFDKPPTHARVVQRENRQNRITSEHKTVWVLDYIVPDTVEERFQEIILDKQWYAQQTTGGAIKEQAQALRKSDLLYVLTGERFE